MVLRQNARTAKRVAIASAFCVALLFILQSVLKDPMREVESSLATAQSDFRTATGQSTIELQIANLKQQAENAQALAERGSPHPDYSPVIAQATQDLAQVQANLNSDFDDVSRLIDALPVAADDLTQQRDQLKQQIANVPQTAEKTAKLLPHDTDVMTFVGLKLRMVEFLVEEIPVLVLGDEAMKRAQTLDWAAKKTINFCDYAIAFFGMLAAGLGIYAAVKRFNVAS